MSEQRRGLLMGVLAYVAWGLFPLYWPLLKPAGAIEILASRIIWSLVFVAVALSVTARWGRIRPILADVRRLRFIAVGAVVIAVNWGTYIWAVNNDHVVESSLGYFINPLVTILMGVLILGERMRPVQWAALAVAAAAVVELTIDYGRLPWIALTLAFSFGTYGLMKKKAAVGAVEGLTLETLTLAPLALIYLGYSQAAGTATFAHDGWLNAVLIAGTGAVTAIPLLLFGGSATRIPLTMVGILQYIAPIMQFAFGLLVFHEAMTTARWVGFALVWLALVAITGEAMTTRRRRSRRAAQAELEPVGG
ncbi:MAG: EamA family transporter RarD [Nocardioidaceae bacterium]